MSTFTFRPLYRQVKETLVKRVAEGVWTAGSMLPSEMDIARELGVSQGTVRKALDEMTADKVLVRRQGVGTFVARHDEERILFQFFRLTPDNGARLFPDSVVTHAVRRAATGEERERLALGATDAVVAIHRVRHFAGEPAIVEMIAVPAALVPGLEDEAVPNNLYALYSARFGVTIAHATERLKAVAATAEEAAALSLPPGTPLLRVDRVAVALDGQAAEWRVSLCRTDRFHYLSELN